MTILPLLKVITPKRVAVVLILVTVFVSGWTVNGWRYQNRMAAKEAALIAEYDKQRSQFLQQFQLQQKIDQAAAEALSADLERVRTDRRELELELKNAELVKSHAEICSNGGNPFGADFSRLWNKAAE